MHQAIQMSDTLWYLGSSDRGLAKFENCHPVPLGISYNFYLIMDEKTVLLGTVNHPICGVFLENIKSVLNDRPLDYIIVNHMELDHYAVLAEVLLRYPEATVMGSAKTHAMIKQFFGDFSLQGKVMQVKEDGTLPIGHHNFRFILVPMVHWPEVAVTYDETEKILFSADAFGTFGAPSGNLYADQLDFDDFEPSEMRRYYSNIVGKYGLQVQALLNKVAGLDIQMICPLRGPVRRAADKIQWFIEKYSCWVTYRPEDNEVVIFYALIYDGIENATEMLANALGAKKVKNIKMYDVSMIDVSYLVSEAFHISHLVFAPATYNNKIFPYMENLIRDLAAHDVQSRSIALVENDSWAPVSGKKMSELFSPMKNMNFLRDTVTLKSRGREEQRLQLLPLVGTIAESVFAAELH